MSKASGIVRCYRVRKGGSVVLVIPKPILKELNVKEGMRFYVKTGSNGRINYQCLDLKEAKKE